MGEEATVVYVVMIGHTDDPFRVGDVFAHQESAAKFVIDYNEKQNPFGFHAWILKKEVK